MKIEITPEELTLLIDALDAAYLDSTVYRYTHDEDKVYDLREKLVDNSEEQ